MGRSIRDGVREQLRDTYLKPPERVTPEDAIRAGGYSRLEPIDCLLGCGQWGIAPRARAALAAIDAEALAVYPEQFHDELLRPAILERFRGLGLRGNQIFFGHGSFNLLERVIHKLLQPGRMLGLGPQFGEIPFEWRLAGGSYEPLPLEPPGYDLPVEAFERALQAEPASVVYVDNPNNPLGKQYPREELERLATACASAGTILVVDEALGDFVEDEESCARLAASHENVIVTRSFSKALGLAAERVRLRVPLGAARPLLPAGGRAVRARPRGRDARARDTRGPRVPRARPPRVGGGQGRDRARLPRRRARGAARPTRLSRSSRCTARRATRACCCARAASSSSPARASGARTRRGTTASAACAWSQARWFRCCASGSGACSEPGTGDGRGRADQRGARVPGGVAPGREGARAGGVRRAVSLAREGRLAGRGLRPRARASRRAEVDLHQHGADDDHRHRSHAGDRPVAVGLARRPQRSDRGARGRGRGRPRAAGLRGCWARAVHPAIRPVREEYLAFRTPRAAYDYVLAERGWHHWSIVDVASVQEVVDVSFDDAPRAVRMLHRLAGLMNFVLRNDPDLWGSRGGGLSVRARAWRDHVPETARFPADRGRVGLPIQEVTSWRDYLALLWEAAPMLLVGTKSNGAAWVPEHPSFLRFLTEAPAGGWPARTLAGEGVRIVPELAARREERLDVHGLRADPVALARDGRRPAAPARGVARRAHRGLPARAAREGRDREPLQLGAAAGRGARVGGARGRAAREPGRGGGASRSASPTRSGSRRSTPRRPSRSARRSTAARFRSFSRGCSRWRAPGLDLRGEPSPREALLPSSAGSRERRSPAEETLRVYREGGVAALVRQAEDASPACLLPRTLRAY